MEKLIFVALVIAVVLFGQPQVAHAQIAVQIDVKGVICGLLPVELQDACLKQGYISGKDPMMSEICDALMFKENKNACHKLIRGHYFSQDGLDFCTRVKPSGAKLVCLRDIIDVRYFQPEAMKACSSMLFSDHKRDCLNTFRNAFIDKEDIETCLTEGAAKDKLLCLKGLSQKVEYPYVIPPPKKRGWFFDRS